MGNYGDNSAACRNRSAFKIHKGHLQTSVSSKRRERGRKGGGAEKEQKNTNKMDLYNFLRDLIL